MSGREFLLWMAGWIVIGLTIGAARKKPKRSFRRIRFGGLGAGIGAVMAWTFLLKVQGLFGVYLWPIGSGLVLAVIWLFLRLSDYFTTRIQQK